MPSLVGYIPIATTLLALAFAGALFRRWRARGGPHHLWFFIGALTYAAGTITESATTLFGWHAPLFRAWYITGALMGGAPLAQGAVYLHLSRKTADRLSMALVLAIVTASVFVIASPIHMELVEPYHLTGKVLTWSWVRAFSPFINTYAAAFLIGGAVKSAWFYAKSKETRDRYVGNVLIAVGALLPGIGGTATRFGHTEVLYVTEFIGLALIIVGYRRAIGGSSTAPHGAPANARAGAGTAGSEQALAR